MITKNIIQKYFEDFANNHYQIKYYGYGDLWEISASEAVEYPLLWVQPIPCSIDGKDISYNYNILVADRLQDGQSNKIEVESDTFQICLDVLASFNYLDDIDLSQTSTITPFIDRFKDDVCGNLMTLNLVVPFDYNECAVPQTTQITNNTIVCN